MFIFFYIFYKTYIFFKKASHFSVILTIFVNDNNFIFEDYINRNIFIKQDKLIDIWREKKTKQ